jgi:hypothetical protein
MHKTSEMHFLSAAIQPYRVKVDVASFKPLRGQIVQNMFQRTGTQCLLCSERINQAHQHQ